MRVIIIALLVALSVGCYGVPRNLVSPEIKERIKYCEDSGGVVYSLNTDGVGEAVIFTCQWVFHEVK